MADRKTVMSWLEGLTQDDWQSFHSDSEVQQIAMAALELLKEQDAKWVEDKRDEHCRLIKCSKCGLTFIVGNNIPYDEWIEDRNYCRRCGARMVKWK